LIIVAPMPPPCPSITINFTSSSFQEFGCIRLQIPIL
jgi:hypothetical protein